MPKREDTLNSAKWDILNEEYKILDSISREGFCFLRANDISEMGLKARFKFEPRLLTYFNNYQSQPALFKDNGISILPVLRGSYVLGKFNPFMKIEGLEEFPVKIVSPAPSWQESSKTELRFNEAMGIAYAEQVGIISDFTGEADLVPTVSGRHGGGSWSYKIKSDEKMLDLAVSNPQIEVDAGFEGRNSLVLIEAKNEIAHEFCLRQLYFPYRAWGKRIAKPVRCVFMGIESDEYYLLEYEFPEPEVFAAKLVNGVHYVVQSNAISRRELEELIKETRAEDSPIGESKFPQANSPATTFSVIEYLFDGPRSKDDIAAHIGFDPRQSDYYGNSAAYFGFAERIYGNRGPFRTTSKGNAFVDASNRERKLMFLRALLERHVFRECVQAWLSTGEIPSGAYINELFGPLTPLNETTIKRRISTVKNWIRWIANTVV